MGPKPCSLTFQKTSCHAAQFAANQWGMTAKKAPSSGWISTPWFTVLAGPSFFAAQSGLPSRLFWVSLSTPVRYDGNITIFKH